MADHPNGSPSRILPTSAATGDPCPTQVTDLLLQFVGLGQVCLVQLRGDIDRDAGGLIVFGGLAAEAYVDRKRHGISFAQQWACLK
jgi:hypothetical protein